MRKPKKTAFLGTLVMFVTVAALVTVTLLVYDYVEAATNGNKAAISAVMLFVILAVSLICSLIDYFRRKLMIDKPVNRILEATDKITKGDFSVQIDIEHPLRRYNEFDYITENLNKMTTELSRTEVLHNDFISNVSHELKTPLAIIQNYATSLRNKNLDEETRAKYTETLIGASNRLSVLVTDILKLNKLEQQEIKPEFEEINLSEMLTETMLEFEDAIEIKNLRLNCDVEEDVRVLSSPSYLDIVWNNLISNAIKFNDVGGSIDLTLKKENGNAVVTLSDTGCGISAETGKHIFEKFYQGDTSHSQEGNGLGLALVKKAIDITGGTVTVSSELGKGTTFTITVRAEN